MCRDKPNKLTSLHEIAQNALLTPNEVEPTIFSFPGVIVQGDMPSSLLSNEEWMERMHQLFQVEYLIPSVTVTNEMTIKGYLLVKIMRR